jgi:DNA polymerase (family 10)
MKNSLVAEILYEVADMLEIKDVEFKPRAYRRAAQAIESMSRPVEEVTAEGKLREIPGVGEAIAEKVEEIVETGRLEYHQKLKKSLPIKVDELLGIEGVGPKKVKLFYKKLGVKSLKDLERAAKKERLRELPGMGEKSEQHILESIEFAKSTGERMLLGYILPVAEEIKERMAALPDVEKAEVAGSIRRRRETIGDIDILVITKHPKRVVDGFVSLPNVSKTVAKGPTRSTVRLKEGIECDLRVIPPGRFGAALMYFTGSKAHNIALRRIAIKRGWKLSEYGLFDVKGKEEKQITGSTEKDIYEKLGLQYIPPEIRENAGEIQAAKSDKLPKLIEDSDIRGDLQMHTKWSDGDNTVEDMARTAERLGHEYIAITDHVGSLKIAGGMGEDRLRKQMAVIEKADKKLKGIKVLKGAEVDIRSDGMLDMKGSVLGELDVVVGSIHSGFRQDKNKMTQRIIAAMESGQVNIIGHPTGRLINRRKGYEFDLEKVFEASKRTGTFLEINAYPNRLDLSAENVRYALESGCKVSMGTDSHMADELRFISLGVATARRGWAEKKDVINTLPLKKLMNILKK